MRFEQTHILSLEFQYKDVLCLLKINWGRFEEERHAGKRLKYMMGRELGFLAINVCKGYLPGFAFGVVIRW